MVKKFFGEGLVNGPGRVSYLSLSGFFILRTFQSINLQESFYGAVKIKTTLTHSVSVLPSYRNQSIDLMCKSVDWFLYEGNAGT